MAKIINFDDLKNKEMKSSLYKDFEWLKLDTLELLTLKYIKKMNRKQRMLFFDIITAFSTYWND